MSRKPPPPPAPARHVQQARLHLAIGDRASLAADVAVTPAGLLAIAALVSSILLSTAVIVRTARPR